MTLMSRKQIELVGNQLIFGNHLWVLDILESRLGKPRSTDFYLPVKLSLVVHSGIKLNLLSDTLLCQSSA